MVKKSYYIVNGITVYRLIAAPVMLLLILDKQADIFKWLLPLSFFTDLIDGFLARRYKVNSVLGSKLDSIADDFTIIVAVTGLFLLRPEFIRREFAIITFLLLLFIVQTILALIRYGRISSFHTYLAKAAAMLQGTFLILIFHLHEPVYPLFYAAALVTAIDLAEEIILVLILPEWEVNVKGLYWVLRKRNSRQGGFY